MLANEVSDGTIDTEFVVMTSHTNAKFDDMKTDRALEVMVDLRRRSTCILGNLILSNLTTLIMPSPIHLQ